MRRGRMIRKRGTDEREEGPVTSDESSSADSCWTRLGQLALFDGGAAAPPAQQAWAAPEREGMGACLSTIVSNPHDDDD